MPKQIGNNVLILGGGRWGQVTYNNLYKVKSISHLELVSKSFNLKENILLNKNILISKYLNLEKYKKYNLIIICKNNLTKNYFLRKLKDFKRNIVVEKPLIIKKNINSFLKIFKKKKYFLSLPWYFDNILKKIYSKILKNNKINRIQFKWFDTNKSKYGLFKKFDNNINYSEDVFSHIFSILNYNKSDLSSLKFIDFKILENIEKLRFSYNNLEIELICSNKFNNSNRNIVFFNDNRKIIKISILHNYYKVKDYKKKLNQRYKRNLNQLMIQYRYILKNKKENSFKRICDFLILYQYELNKFLKN